MSQSKPALSVNVNVPGPKSRNVNGKAAAQARASAQAPSLQGIAQTRQQANTKPGKVISEEELMAQGGGGFDSDDEEPQNPYASSEGTRGATANTIRPGPNGQAMQDVDGQYIEDSEGDEEEAYGPGEGDVDMGSEEEDGIYDEDEEDELSSSPSIPDENIDFDLVYALHNFIATVEGQATVNKGNNLTLLDDSNSYWWLVRVLRTQEVGYIPAENIETPFERLARLNKHRNVDLTSATDDDHMQVPEKIYTSHLIKQRSFGAKGVSSHSGKLSALSLRNQGLPPSSHQNQRKRGVQFGPPTYLEHSGNEMTDEEDYDDEEEEEEYVEEEEEEDGEEEGEEEGIDEGDVGPMNEIRNSTRKVGPESAVAGGAAAAALAATSTSGPQRQGQNQMQMQQQQQSQPQQRRQKSGQVQNISQPRYLNQMEPDDGMDWDAQEAEKVQRAQEERNAAKDAAEQRRVQDETQRKQMIQQAVEQAQQQISGQQPQTLQQRSMQGSQPESQQLRMLQQQRPMQYQRGPEQTLSRVLSPDVKNGRPSQERQGSLDRQQNMNGQVARERSSSDASSQYTVQSNSAGRVSPGASPDGKKDKKGNNRKSKTDEELTDEKQGKKRSGVFSGLFSRSKDKKERKSSNSSAHQRGGSNDADSLRSSEDSSIRRSLVCTSNNGQSHLQQSQSQQQQPLGLGRAVQEKDRAVQEAYQRQFLQDHRRDQRETGIRPARPGSLIGTPSTVPMLNVLRVFAGNDIESDATFKTVLLNETTTAYDLVRQAMQRFRLGNGHVMNDYVMTVKMVEGNERILAANEKPLRVFDQLTAALNRQGPAMPRVKRSSVGSISSISSNLSLNPAIARLENDFSDDHDVKFYLNRKTTITHDLSMDQTMASAAATNGSFADTSQYESSQSIFTSTNETTSVDPGSTDTHDTLQSINVAKFALRLLIFPSDLPEGIIFDPQTNALIPERTLMERGSAGRVPGEGVEQHYREKILALPRNTTVAEVIEQGLDRFGIMDGVVEGGDDVEERTSRRKSKGRIRFGLCVDANIKGVSSTERSLAPASRVLDAYTSPPFFRAAPLNRRGGEGRRRSQDSAMLLSLAEEISPSDPIFILRQIHTHAHLNHKSKSARALSPTEDVLAQKQTQRRQNERDSVAATPSEPAMEEARLAALASAAAAATPQPNSQGNMTRQEIITAQRTAAQERRAAVLGAQRNEERGVDVVLQDHTRIRSSKTDESDRVQYSYIPPEGQGRDITDVVEDVFQDQHRAKQNVTPSMAATSNSSLLAPPKFASRMNSATTLDDYESAPTSPGERSSPLSLREVHMSSTAPLQVESRGYTTPLANTQPVISSSNESDDILDNFIRNPNTANSSIEDRIDQVLTRVGAPIHQSSSSRETATSPASGLTHQSGTSTITPISATVAGVVGAAGAAIGTMTSSLVGTTTTQSRNVHSANRGIDTETTRISRPMLPLPNSDFGLDNLYAIIDAAARKKPALSPKSTKRQLPHLYEGSDSTIFSPVIAGLFPPPSPHITDRRIKEAYAPIGKHLNGIEESLDQLLNDVLHTF